MNARIQDRLFIGGEFVDSADGATFEVVNPHDGTKLAESPKRAPPTWIAR